MIIMPGDKYDDDHDDDYNGVVDNLKGNLGMFGSLFRQ
jgi:hypothetical protein